MKRGRADIVAGILEIAQEGAIKTKLMYRGFLSHPQLMEYLDLLTDIDLLKYSEETRQYHTTEKGLRFLQFYKDVGKIIAPKESRVIMMY